MKNQTSPSTRTPTTRPHSAQRPSARYRRVLPISLATALLSVSALAVGPSVTAASASVQTSRVALVDWNDSFGSGGYGYGGYGSGDSRQGQESNPWGSSGGATTTANSDPATAAESRGVVLIDTVLGYQDAAAAGTGIVLTSNGEVVTNYHVVEGATSIKVTIASTGKTYTATVVGHDQTDDVALLQLKGAAKLTTAKIDHDTVAKGDKVTAVGNAGGTDSLTAAAGTVSALKQTITTESEGSTAGETLKNLIMTDADVVPGDSGGPLYDAQNEVVGIDAAASSGGEIDGYAIPIAKALTIVKQIASGQETSRVEIGAAAFLGVEVGDSSSSAASGFPGQDSLSNGSDTSGAVVEGVVADGPAAKAGLQAGDTVTALGGMTVTSAESVSTLIKSYQAGDRVKISWTDSNGAKHSATTTLAASPVA
jgi:S1-C subfamily serine protease